jgi:Fasciclin domain
MAVPAAFGSDCGMITATGMGSFHGMSMDLVVTAASHNPLLTSFAADVKTAGLTSELDSMHAITVFAPANSAFSKLSAAQMSMLHKHARACQDPQVSRGQRLGHPDGAGQRDDVLCYRIGGSGRMRTWGVSV